MLRQHIVGFFQLVNVDVDFVRFQNKVRPERAQVDAIRVLVNKPIGNDGTALNFIKNGIESGVERSLFGVGPSAWCLSGTASGRLYIIF